MPEPKEGQVPDEGQKPKQEPTAQPGQEPGGDGQSPEPKTYSEEYVKELRGEAANYRKQLRDAEDKLASIDKERTEAEEAKLKEQQQWQEIAEKRETEMAELKDQLAQMESEAQERLVQASVSEAAHEKGIDSRLAWRVIDLTEVTYDDEGNPTNIEKLLDAAIEEFGLVANNERQLSGIPGTSGTAPKPGKLTPEEKRRQAAHITM